MNAYRRRRAASFLLAAAVTAAGCARGTTGSPPAAAPPLAVTLVRPSSAAGSALELPARVTAHEEVTLTARLAGRLTALPRREGDSFRAGEPLARFDAPETRAALDGARAALASAELARDLARRQEARMDSLRAERVAAVRELEGAQADRRAAEAAWAGARAQYEQMASGVVIVAPFDGVVVRRRADTGTTVGPGQPLLDVRSLSAGEITASVPESELEALAHATASYQVGDGAWQPATLVRVDGMTDPSTRSRVARFRPATAAALEPGAFARVRLARAGAGAQPADARPALTVPARALVRRGELAGVFVVEQGVARLRWLRVGREAAGGCEVLAGLAASDEVVGDPAGLEDGRAVTVAR